VTSVLQVFINAYLLAEQVNWYCAASLEYFDCSMLNLLFIIVILKLTKTTAHD